MLLTLMKRAAALAALFIASTPAFSNQDSIIQRAQQLTLEGRRKEVADLFLRSLENQKLSTKETRRLRTAQGRLLRVFYTDKGQKSFELAESLRQTGS